MIMVRIAVNTLIITPPINTKIPVPPVTDSIKAGPDPIPITVKGIIRQNDTKEPIIGAFIYLKQNIDKGVVTDVGGRFELDVTETFANKDSLSLIIGYIGSQSQELTIYKDEFKQIHFLDVQLIELHSSVTSFVVYEKLPWHKRLWNWLTNPFKK